MTPMRRRVRRLMPFGFLLVVLCFVGSTIFSQYTAARIDAASDALAFTASPSIEHLAAVRQAAAGTYRAAEGYVASKAQGKPASRQTLDAALLELDRELDAYFAFGAFPGEERLRAAIAQGRDRLRSSAERAAGEADAGDIEAARRRLEGEVRPDQERLIGEATNAIDLNARQSAAFAKEIKSIRQRSLEVSLTLDVLTSLLSLVFAVVFFQQLRRREEISDAHQQVLEQRANELEMFSGRVAHDILSPLSVVRMALDLTSRDELRPRTRAQVERGLRSLVRVQSIIDGLLEFARAGAPNLAARADVSEVVEGVVTELGAEAARAGVTLTVDASAPGMVACSPGVLTSLVSNLGRNAIKYMGERPVREVVVRTRAEGERVRVSVSDTGPGLAPELVSQVFDLYVRGRNVQVPGLGLGLATVKRLVEAHGGTVGVESRPGEGSVFWFELPKAPPAAEPPVGADERRTDEAPRPQA